MRIEAIATEKTDYYLNLDDVKKKLSYEPGFDNTTQPEFKNMIFHKYSKCEINTTFHKVCQLSKNITLTPNNACDTLYLNEFKLHGRAGSLTITRFNNTFTCITDNDVIVFNSYEILSDIDINIKSAVIFSKTEYDAFMRKFKLKKFVSMNNITAKNYLFMCRDTNQCVTKLKSVL
jgi:hypothetical protein